MQSLSMNLSKYQCINCQKSAWLAYSTYWECRECGQRYTCVKGLPRLYLESGLGQQDVALRDYLYNDFLGTYYKYVMPFLALPARPAKSNWKGWAIYFVVVAALLLAVGHFVKLFFFAPASRVINAFDVALLLVLLAVAYFFFRRPYLFFLLLIAVPVKISLIWRRFRPEKSFPEIHADLIERFQGQEERLQVLDISTGTCNSLYRHGWMKLKADYTGLDLSDTMLLQGLDFMSRAQVPMDFVLGDAARLPFTAESFDIVLNYGALNGYTDAGAALSEMARVTKKGGLMLFLDEQLYDSASFVEKIYFKQVLSSHNVIHRCPVELIPPCMEHVTVHQVYQFYYLCTAFER